jgi:hypothetical protein
MSDSALISAAEAADLAATAEEEEELVSGSEDESGAPTGDVDSNRCTRHCARSRWLYMACVQLVLSRAPVK